MNTLTTQGITIPRLGLGTFRMQGDTCQQAVATGLNIGYRHIDTAQMYGNEEAVGAGIRHSGVARGDIHLTTKVWHDQLTPAGIRAALEGSLSKLGTDYVDLFMVHWPTPEMDLEAIFRTMTALKDEGLIRAIGVCNFTVPMLKEVVETLQVPLACNQIEYHVLLDQTPVRSFLAPHHIPVTAYCPLAQGLLAEHPELQAIADKHNASAAQIALAYLLAQPQVMVIPKSSREAGLRSNFEAQNITLSDEELARLHALPKDQRRVQPAFAPHWDN